MAFAIRNLSVLAYANGFTLWHYKAAADDSEAVGARNYFKAAGDMLTAGDFLVISSPGGGRVMCVVPDGRGLGTAPLG
jgi:hypothetical protein